MKSEKTVRVFGLASFFNDLGSDMIYPVWPLFLTVFLGADMTVLGLIDGLGDAVVSMAKALSGYASDRLERRKVFIWSGYVLGAFSRVGYALSSTWAHVIPFRVMDRAGKIRGAPRDAIIADISTRASRGRNFGFVRAMDNLGAVCGIIVCIVLFRRLGYRDLFLLAALPSVIATLLVLLFIGEKRSPRTRIYRGLSMRDLDGNFRLLLASGSVFALGAFSYSFLLIYAKNSGFHLTFIPVLYLIYTGVASLFSMPFGSLSDRTGRKAVLMVSLFLWVLVCLCLIFVHGHAVVFVVFILYGLHKGALEPVQRTLVAELAPERYRASCLGGFQMVTGLCALPASLVAGVLWDRAGMTTPFYLSLLLTLLSMAMLAMVREKRSAAP